MKTSYERRVDKGIKFLNKKNPDWFTKIKLYDLDMCSCYHCILGQLYSEYMHGRACLRVSHNRAAEMGFNVRGTRSVNESFSKLDRLGEIWVRRIKELLNANAK